MSELRTAHIARLMQWHWDDQTTTRKRDWCLSMVRLIDATDATVFDISWRWGIRPDVISEWLDIGVAVAQGEPVTYASLDADLSHMARELVIEDSETHYARCVCDIVGESVDRALRY